MAKCVIRNYVKGRSCGGFFWGNVSQIVLEEIKKKITKIQGGYMVLEDSKWALPECKSQRLPRDTVRSIRKIFQFTSQILKSDWRACIIRHVRDTEDNLRYKYICPHGENKTVVDKFDTHGSVHRRLLSRNTNKMQLCNRIYYSKVFEGSACFERHTAHHQEL
jgi:hypothetical protein